LASPKEHVQQALVLLFINILMNGVFVQAGLADIKGWGQYMGAQWCGDGTDIERALEHSNQAVRYLISGKDDCVRKACKVSSLCMSYTHLTDRYCIPVETKKIMNTKATDQNPQQKQGIESRKKTVYCVLRCSQEGSVERQTSQSTFLLE
jgi:hypothetical protein